MNRGYIKLYRRITEWEWFTDMPTYFLFTYLLLKANYKDKMWRGIQIKRGQLLTSRNTLANETKLSEQQIRTALKHLTTTNEITIETTNKNTLITICNFESYQAENYEANQQSNQQDNTQITNNQPTTNQELTTTKEIKKEKNERNEELLKEKNIKKESKKELDQKFKQSLLELGVSEPIADEWLSVRKGKRNSDIVIRHLIKAANEAGISVQQAVEFSAERQYIGFEASWYIKAMNEQRKTQGAGGGVGVSSNGIYTKEQWQAITDAGEKIGEMLGMRTK